MSIIGSTLLAAAETAAYTISRSVRLRSSASAYFNRTFGTPTNASKWTKSFWVKRGTLGSVPIIAAQTVSASANYAIQFNADSTLTWQFSNTLFLTTTQVFRDPSAWYHIVMVWDAANATAANRAILYINGMQVTTFVTDNRASVSASQNAWETAGTGYISYNNGTNSFDGYLTEVNFIDGQALTPSSFGETDPVTGVWKPKRYASTYGTNGFYLNFSDNSAATAAAIGKDSSGNGNNWTPNNISLTSGATYDSMIDTPTMYDDGGNGRGNYAVLLSTAGQGNGAYSDGNLGFKSSTANQWKGAHSSIFVPSGKFYFEATIQALSANNYFMIGACGIQTNATLYANYTGQVANGWSVQCNGATGGTKYNNNATANVSNASFASWVAGDTLQCAVDVDNGRIWFGRNNVWLEGNPSAGTGASYTNLTGVISPSVSVYTNGVDKLAANFGQRPFAYTPPTGFKAVNTFNLAAPTIPNGATQFAATTYTGTGSARSVTNTVNGVSFQPDLIWSKSRSNAYNHYIEDSIRGATKALSTNQTIAEFTGAQLVTSFNSNGFSVGTDAEINGNAATFVGWQWKASNAAAVTNTSGSITSSVSANPSAGFSIVTYTGTSVAGTIGHGLGIAPKMIIVKPRTATVTTDSWNVYHSSIGNTQFLVLDSTAAAVTANTRWNNTSPTSSVFSIGTVPSSNGVSYVAYCFAEIAGFSQFGSYTGNGSADGPFVYLGFRPRWLLLKLSSNIDAWLVIDSSRQTYNVMGPYLSPNSSAAEATTSFIDFTANGFKIRGTGSSYNTSSGTIIYAAFAESPFNYSLAR